MSEIKCWDNEYSYDWNNFVYNPFAILLFKIKKFNPHWFETWTTTFLIEQVNRENDLKLFVKLRTVNSGSLKEWVNDNKPSNSNI